jgi:hypothetical protein
MEGNADESSVRVMLCGGLIVSISDDVNGREMPNN